MLIIINCLLLYILCIDIDECLSGPCPSDTICNNMDGTYACDCPDGTMRSGANCVCKSLISLKVYILTAYTIIYATYLKYSANMHSGSYVSNTKVCNLCVKLSCDSVTNYDTFKIVHYPTSNHFSNITHLISNGTT